MQTTSRSRRLALVLVTIAALTLGACSAAGSDDADAATTTSANRSSTTVTDETTTTADDDTSTTEADDPSDGPTSEDLEALLPTAADLGTGWSVDKDDDDSTDSDDELDRQCPDVAALDADDDDDDHVDVSFANPDNQLVSVEFDPSARELSDEELDQYVTAINACTGTITDPDNGSTTKFSFDVSQTDVFGDQGVQIEGTLTISGGSIPKPITITVYSLSYRNGSVGVEITGQDGVDDATLALIPFDPDLLITLGRDLDPQVTELVAG